MPNTRRKKCNHHTISKKLQYKPRHQNPSTYMIVFTSSADIKIYMARKNHRVKISMSIH